MGTHHSTRRNEDVRLSNKFPQLHRQLRRSLTTLCILLMLGEMNPEPDEHASLGCYEGDERARGESRVFLADNTD